MAHLSDSLSFRHGATVDNRVTLAPLTNQQSHADGTLSDDEYRWLTRRAAGGFGLTMTCASHVSAIGQGFPGQLGCFDDRHLEGLTRLATGIRAEGSLSVVQLHHAGRRSPRELIGQAPVGPSEDEKTGTRALSTHEVEHLIEDFVAAAKRCEQAGFDGVQIHGAHDYIVCEFLNREYNQRTDHYGGSVENRARLLLEILGAIRAATGPHFNVSVRLSPERFGLHTADILETYRLVLASELADFVDISLWDVTKEATDEQFAGRSLLELFTEIPRGETRLCVAGKIYSAADAQACLDRGADLVAIGRAAITNHDFARAALTNSDFTMRELPVSRATLAAESLSESFITYMSGWPGFVEE
jgi:2,4-dienoyl-CoA reductase-like NADH-dependent reductase (Old Yellow Enzyme family)